MVLGLRNKKSEAAINLDYQIQFKSISAWPPSPALRDIKDLAIHWENGDRNSGHFSCNVGDQGVLCNDAFRIHVLLKKEASRKGTIYAKNILEFSIHEGRKGKASKGHHLASAAVNLADYGIVKSDQVISCPLTFKKPFRSVTQSVLSVVIKPFSSSATVSEIDDGSEFAAFTDDDAEPVEKTSLSNATSEDLSSELSTADQNSKAHDQSSLQETNTKQQEDETQRIAEKKIVAEIEQEGETSSCREQKKDVAKETLLFTRNGKGSSSEREDETQHFTEQSKAIAKEREASQTLPSAEQEDETLRITKQRKEIDIGQENETLRFKEQSDFVSIDQEDETVQFAEDMVEEKMLRKHPTMNASLQTRREKLKHLKSAQILYGSLTSASTSTNDDSLKESSKTSNQILTDKPQSKPSQTHDVEVDKGKKSNANKDEASKESSKISERTPIAKSQSKSKTSQPYDAQVSKDRTSLQERIDNLEEELTEVAAIEFGLYAVIPEHGSSSTKVHSSATRLSRFYFASKKRSNAAKAIVSGFVLVSKSCANDVPRLTFWLSNAIALRTIVKRDRKEEPFVSALERVESWIFTRIIESIWWQILTPRMQWSAARTKQNKRQSEENYAIELWKNAFKEAYESLCPVRAAGHECGCLPFLPKLVMEQLVIRLDVAMFNAILRESDDEMPTDPISDPISDPKVLPIPAGRFSFGAGARLKNAVGSWSRWLTGLFGIDDNENEDETDRKNAELPFKPFHLLHSLSDLMMLPFELLNDSASRKEVLPAFGSWTIRRVLESFAADEFNPKPRCEEVVSAMEADDDEGSEYPMAAAAVVYSAASVASVRRLVSSIGEKDGDGGSTVEDGFEELDPAVVDSLLGSQAAVCRDNSRFLLLRRAWTLRK